MKHTPGPWAISDAGTKKPCQVYQRENGTLVAQMFNTEGNYEANAHLIAAAPEMLNALENAIEEFRPKECNCDGGYGDDGTGGYACYFHRVEEEFKRAIAKATGGK